MNKIEKEKIYEEKERKSIPHIHITLMSDNYAFNHCQQIQ